MEWYGGFEGLDGDDSAYERGWSDYWGGELSFQCAFSRILVFIVKFMWIVCLLLLLFVRL